MTTFLDKLKKGMENEKTFDELTETDERLEEEEEKEEKNVEPIKKQKPQTEPAVTFVSTPIAIKKTPKTKKTKKAPSALAKTESVDKITQQKPKEKVNPMKKIKVEKVKNIRNEGPFEEKKWFEPEGELTVDVYQTDKEIVIQSALAGVEAENLDIFIENDLVSIKGNRAKPFIDEKKNYFYQECYWGPFSREIILPEEVDPSRINATMKQGVLTIRIPKVEREKKRKVEIVE